MSAAALEIAAAVHKQIGRDYVRTGARWGQVVARTLMLLRLAGAFLRHNIGTVKAAVNAAIDLYEVRFLGESASSG